MSEIVSTPAYSDADFQTLDWNIHLRMRPGMYIGKQGDGTTPDDGLYVLIKEVIDNAVDEYRMKAGKKVEITIENDTVTVRDYGRGIPLGKVIDAASKMNTGAKFDTSAFQKSVGLNGVGLKAVNALSSHFYIQAFRDGSSAWGRFTEGTLKDHADSEPTTEKDGTLVRFTPDKTIFPNYTIQLPIVQQMLKHYSYLNVGLRLVLNGTEYLSRNGLLDLMEDSLKEAPLYPYVHLRGEDIEIVLSHTREEGENIYSYVNGQNTLRGGTHLAAFREAAAKTIKEFFKKDFENSDVRQSMVGAIAINIQEPMFVDQPKTLLDSKMMTKDGPSLRSFIGDFVKEHLDNYLHKNPETAQILLKRIQESEKLRKEVSAIKKKNREASKKVNLHNRKLRDCRYHFTDKRPEADLTSIFITEGDSASGSITQSRDPNVQAVFSLRGKPLNAYGMTKTVVYQNEEFNLLQAALDIEEGLDGLRYNKVIIATDADPDGMHIRLLLTSFFLQFFPELVRTGHVYVLETPLFRVRNKKETRYCYTEAERETAIKALSPKPEITRFKGLGEISAVEFQDFIGEKIRLSRLYIEPDDRISELLRFYMGKNDDVRRDFILNNLRIVEE